jgi:hypothetical protein
LKEAGFVERSEVKGKAYFTKVGWAKGRGTNPPSPPLNLQREVSIWLTKNGNVLTNSLKRSAVA